MLFIFSLKSNLFEESLTLFWFVEIDDIYVAFQLVSNIILTFCFCVAYS